MTADHIAARQIIQSLRLRNAAASVALVCLACGLYAIAPHNAAQMSSAYRLAGLGYTGYEFLFFSGACYTIALIGFCVADPHPEESKSVQFFKVVGAFIRSPRSLMQRGLSRAERLAVLSTVLKGFFGPFMVMALMSHVVGAFVNGAAIITDASMGLGFFEMFNRHGYWLALKIILFADVVVFTVGYLVEMPRLKNEIRSVDPTWLGWTAALLCYPPFNQVTSAILGSAVTDFPQFDEPMTHVALNVALLLLMAIYASASVALGLKASNLTHRGIVDKGPYRWVRHPAYVCKNMAWWIGSVPLVSASFATSNFAGISTIATVMGWTLLYALRAVTEEDHLRSVDSDYAAYASRVRYRFIPGVV